MKFFVGRLGGAVELRLAYRCWGKGNTAGGAKTRANQKISTSKHRSKKFKGFRELQFMGNDETFMKAAIEQAVGLWIWTRSRSALPCRCRRPTHRCRTKPDHHRLRPDRPCRDHRPPRSCEKDRKLSPDRHHDLFDHRALRNVCRCIGQRPRQTPRIWCRR